MSELIESFGLKGAQRDAVTARERDIVVTAGAGSGKTLTLAARYVSLLNDGFQPGQIAAVTFTEKAAREMRNRIRYEITRWRTSGCSAADRPRWEAIEADIDAALIGTIHSLCAYILRAHPAEAGVDPLFEVLDEGLTAAIKAQAVDDALGWAVDQAELKPLFDVFRVHELRDALSRLLEARLDWPPAPEPGKIESIWRGAIRQAISNFAHDGEVCAALDMIRDLRDSGRLEADAGEKLAAQARGLLAEWDTLEQALESGDCTRAVQALQAVRSSHSALNIGSKGSRAKEATYALRRLYAAKVEPWLGDKPTPPDPEIERRAAEVTSLLSRLAEEAGRLYQSAKDLRQAVDFDDLEAGAVRLLGYPGVRARWQRKIAAVLVDEFQDTNERQRNIVEALAGVHDQVSGRLFVVGDAKQSIYRFRGANVVVFRRLDADVRARGGEAITLDLTFRAHAGLVEALNELLGGAMGQVDDPRGLHCVPFSPLRPHRTEPAPGIKPPYVEFLYGLGESADQSRPVAARMLTARLWELHDNEGVKWDDIALLFRAAAGFTPYEAALEEAGIPFVTVAGKGFYDRPEIRDILNIVRALADPWDDLAMAGLLRSPAFGLSDTALYRLRWPAGADPAATPASFRQALKGDLSLLPEPDRTHAERAGATIERLLGLVDRVTVAELIKALLDATHYQAVLASARSGTRLQRNIDKLLADAHASGIVRAAEFLEYVETLRESGAREGEAPAEAGGAVRLMTVHKAKGLEFPVVVIADATRSRPETSGPILLSGQLGIVPCPQRFERKPLIQGLAKAEDAEQADAEDRRVLYVAATRAREKLLVCGHYSARESRSWMAALAEAAGISLRALTEHPGERCVVTLPASGQQVAALALAATTSLDRADESVSRAGAEPDSNLAPMCGPVAARMATDADIEPVPTVFRIRRVTGHRRHTDGTIVGTLVHEALRRWRFPGDPALQRLLTTTALSSGLVDGDDIDEHVRRATELLARLRHDARWSELASAQRHHEVPFALLRNGQPSIGSIDLLYKPAGRQTAPWTIVDFKTDHITSEAELEAQRERYRPQMYRYRHAVSRLLGGPIEIMLCFLDYNGSVLWVDVSASV